MTIENRKNLDDQSKGSQQDKTIDSKSQSGQSGDIQELDGIISDLDLSKVSENVRQEVKKIASDYLVNKVKNYDRDYRSKTEKLAQEREVVAGLTKVQELIDANPQSAFSIVESYVKQRFGDSIEFTPKQKETEKRKADRLFDEMMDDAKTQEEKDALRRLQNLIKEESDSSKIKEVMDEVKLLKQTLQNIQINTQTTVAEHINKELDNISLLGKESKEIVDKYRKNVVQLAKQYPSLTVKRLLANVATEDEYETIAVISKLEKNKQQDKQKKLASDSRSEDANAPEISVQKDKFGRVNLTEAISKAVAKARRTFAG